MIFFNTIFVPGHMYNFEETRVIIGSIGYVSNTARPGLELETVLS